MSPVATSIDLTPKQDPEHRICHGLVAKGIVQIARVVADDGTVLFEAYDYNPGSPDYAWRTSIMSAPAFEAKHPTTTDGVV